jgi:hypothetical protein
MKKGDFIIVVALILNPADELLQTTINKIQSGLLTWRLKIAGTFKNPQPKNNAQQPFSRALPKCTLFIYPVYFGQVLFIDDMKTAYMLKLSCRKYFATARTRSSPSTGFSK